MKGAGGSREKVSHSYWGSEGKRSNHSGTKESKPTGCNIKMLRVKNGKNKRFHSIKRQSERGEESIEPPPRINRMGGQSAKRGRREKCIRAYYPHRAGGKS